jgi:hypothetical protein
MQLLALLSSRIVIAVFWRAVDSSQGERGLLLDMLDSLPAKSRLAIDAFYFGFEFWPQLIDKKLTFVVRAGSNLEPQEILINRGGKIRQRRGLFSIGRKTP